METMHDQKGPEVAFGTRLRAMRTAHGWSQAELGRRVYVSADLIGKVEKGVRRPTPDLARRLDATLEAHGELIRAREGVQGQHRPVGHA